jgi:hypothetical protein
MARLLVLAIAIAPWAVAQADAFETERIPVKLAVGETREIEVGFARMHVCDDISIVHAEMRDKNPQTNVFVIKGLQPGTTDCRAGMEPDRPTFLFKVTVEKAKPKK